MPAVYAHDRFGKKVSECMQGDIKEIIEKYYPQYQIGLQGPDIFFFYRGWSSNQVVDYGNQLHHISALSFFEHACHVVQKKGRDSREYAYLLGFICHFTLDSECHSYVDAMVAETGAHHLEIEAEFEKVLLRMDGNHPLGFPVADLIPVDDETAASIAPFYAKSIDEKIVKQSLKDMRLIKKVFTAPGIVKQSVIDGIMHLTGHYASVKGLMNHRKDNPACTQSNEGLLERFNNAVAVGVHLIEELDRCIQTGAKLPERFDRDFE